MGIVFRWSSAGLNFFLTVSLLVHFQNRRNAGMGRGNFPISEAPNLGPRGKKSVARNSGSGVFCRPMRLGRLLLRSALLKMCLYRLILLRPMIGAVGIPKFAIGADIRNGRLNIRYRRM